MTTGLCFSPSDEDKLARGWPNLVEPVDGLPQDKRPAKAAEKAWRANDPVHFTEWPRLTLHRFLHAAMATGFVQYLEPQWKAIQAGFEKPEPPAADALLAALRHLFREGYDTYAFHERDFVYGVETIAGTDATLSTLVDEMVHFEVPKEDRGLNHYTRAHLAETAHFLMLRASKAAVKEARAGLVKAAGVSLPPDYAEYLEALDYAVNGAAGVKRRMGTWVSMTIEPISMGPSLEYAADDPAFVRQSVQTADKKAPMSARVAWIAGPSALEGLEARKWPAAQLPSIVRDFGMLRDPNVMKLMLALVGKSSVKDAPLQWFRAHADYARPFLARQTGTTAKAVLGQL